LKLRLTGEEERSCCDRESVSQARRGKEERREMFVCFAIPKLQMFGPTIGPVKKVHVTSVGPTIGPVKKYEIYLCHTYQLLMRPTSFAFCPSAI
jgi:hypothetical protein